MPFRLALNGMRFNIAATQNNFPQPARRARIHFANFKYRLKIGDYHRCLFRLDAGAQLSERSHELLQLDNDWIVDLSIAVAPQNFFSDSRYTCHFFAGIVSLFVLPSSIKMLADNHEGQFANMCSNV